MLISLIHIILLVRNILKWIFFKKCLLVQIYCHMGVLTILLLNKTSPNAKKQILGIADDFSKVLLVVNNEGSPWWSYFQNFWSYASASDKLEADLPKHCLRSKKQRFKKHFSRSHENFNHSRRVFQNASHLSSHLTTKPSRYKRNSHQGVDSSPRHSLLTSY